MKAVIVENLEKSFGKKKVLKGISFEVEKGEVFGLIGPNGAGKTTTLRIISTILSKDAGNVRVFGIEVSEDPFLIKKNISYLPEEAGVYKNMTGREYLKFMASFYTEDTAELNELVRCGEELSELGKDLDKKVMTYSKGMVRKLALARTLMVKPKLAILDEPTSGLDVLTSLKIRNLIKKMAKDEGITFLISSHNMLEIEYICERVALINQGRIVEMGTPKKLKEKYNAANLEEVFVEVTKNVL